jgi:hypothetical protein
MNVFAPSYTPGTVPDKITIEHCDGHQDKVKHYEEGQDFSIFVHGSPIGYRRQYMDRSYIEPTIAFFTSDVAKEIVAQFKQLNDEFPFKVIGFEYNGFMGNTDPNETMPYRVRFVKWSGDPGVAVMACSDGKERLIPTFAMPGAHWCLPVDMTRVEGDGNTTLFGAASKS